ncbi:MAG: hypothetical protein EXX96DRAFT_623498 [Benjaminiella poitrasii]|nr:MAG: hypothetical protein EXX96DRAFT_623498 [Benjaminiella poitrasii]
MLIEKTSNDYPFLSNIDSIHDPMTTSKLMFDEEKPTITDKQTIDLMRKEIIQRATNRLRRRQLEQNVENVIQQIISLKAHLEVLHMEAVTTRNIVTNLSADHSDAEDGSSAPNELQRSPEEYAESYEYHQRMGRRMDTLERRLQSHRSSLVEFQTIISNDNKGTEESQPTKESIVLDKIEQMKESQTRNKKSTSESYYNNVEDESSLSRLSPVLYPLSVLSAPSLSLMTSILEKASSVCSFSSHDSPDDATEANNAQSLDVKLTADNPFYDLAGKRSFRTGNFCGSVYNDNNQDQAVFTVMPTPDNDNSELELRFRQRHKYRYQKHLELKVERQQYEERLYGMTHGGSHDYLNDNDSIIFDDHDDIASVFSSVQSLPALDLHRPSDATTATLAPLSNSNDLYNHAHCHPLSPITPPPNIDADFFFVNQLQPQKCSASSSKTSEKRLLVDKLDDSKSRIRNDMRDKTTISHDHEPRELVPQQQQQQQRPRYSARSQRSAASHIPLPAHHEYKYLRTHIYPQRNTLDDLMNYLDNLGSNDADSIISDGYHLLNNLQDCNRPYSKSLMNELRQRDRTQNRGFYDDQDLYVFIQYLLQLMNPWRWYKLYVDLIYNLTYVGFKWCHFISMITIAFFMNILKGPEALQERLSVLCHFTVSTTTTAIY